jgi:transglutaminase-like putative cysteine protease
MLGNVEIRRGWKAAIILSAGGGFTFLNAVDLWSEVTGLSLKLAAYRFVRIAPDLMGDPQVMTELADQAWVKVQDFIAILEVWITQLSAGAPISIDQITEFVWGLAGFGMIAWAGWHLHIRLRPYLAVAPAILLMMVSVGVTDEGHGMFGLLLAVSLLIVVLFSHLDRERRWARAGHGYSTEIRPDLILFTLAIGISFFMIGAALPSVSAKKIIDRLREDRAAARETTDLGSGLGLYDQLPDDAAAASGGLPSSHLLTGEPELLDTLMFQVWVEDDPKSTVHGYWRTHIYQEYTGRGWLGGNVLPQRFGAGQRIEPSAGKDRVFLTIRAEGIYPRKRMVYANQIVWASQPVTAYLRESPEGTVDLSSVTISAQVYQVESARPSASVVDLQASGDVYPSWVADRYLQLPEGVPQRVIDLAAEITSNRTDPYARAVAIEKYLRQFPYTLDIPGPPADQDVADYFLFELQQGYCDYYATTMVVLARSIGLPARVVSGYRGGELDETTGAIQVAGDNAHSWVEVYFNGIGWI